MKKRIKKPFKVNPSVDEMRWIDAEHIRETQHNKLPSLAEPPEEKAQIHSIGGAQLLDKGRTAEGTIMLPKNAKTERNISPDNGQASKGTSEIRNIVQVLTQKLETDKPPKYIQEHLHDVSQKVIEAIEVLTRKINGVAEENIKNERITANMEVINKRYESLSDEVSELKSLIQNLIHEVNKLLKEELRGEFIAKEEAMRRRCESLSNEIAELRKGNDSFEQKVKELEQSLKNDLSSKQEALDRRFEEMSRIISEQEALIDQFSKVLVRRTT